MITDYKTQYSNAQALSGTAAATIVSTNAVDHGPLATGNTNPTLGLAGIRLKGVVTTTCASTGSATLTVIFTSDDNTGLTSTAAVFTALASTAVASLTAGFAFDVLLPVGVNYERYTQLSYVVGTAPLSVGAISAQLVSEPGLFRAFAQDSRNTIF